MTAVLGQSYVLHTPEAVRDALRRGALCVNHPYRAGPFFLLLPLNTQPARLTVNRWLPGRHCEMAPPRLAIDRPRADRQGAVAQAMAARAGTTRRCGVAEARALRDLLADRCAVTHAQNMHVGGSEGRSAASRWPGSCSSHRFPRRSGGLLRHRVQTRRRWSTSTATG
jgi:3D-(3,5/4)-trihydroxycyclohexane-1,2-dione acylhydrolase (decyclizing)